MNELAQKVMKHRSDLHRMLNSRLLVVAILVWCAHSTSQQVNQTNTTNSTFSPSPKISTTVKPTTKTSSMLEHCVGGKDVWNICWLSNPPYVFSNDPGNNTDVAGILIETLIEGLKICKCKTKLNFKRAKNYDDFLNCSKSEDIDIVLPFPTKEADLLPLLFTVVDSPEVYLLLNRKAVETEAKKRVLSQFFSVWTIAVLTVLLAIIFGIIVWFLDFSWNNEQFPPSFFPGSLEGVWWSFVTLTTVGYGDKTPKFSLARILAVVWMFIGMLMISLLTATMTKALTTAVFDYQTYIQSKNRIGVLNHSYTYDEAVKKGVQPYEFSNLSEMYQTLDDPNNNKIAGIFVDIFVATYVRNNAKRYKLTNTLFVAKSYDVVYPLAFYLAPGISKHIFPTPQNHFKHCFQTTFLTTNKQINVYAIVDKYIQRSSANPQNQDRGNQIKFEIDLFKSTEETFITGLVILTAVLTVLIVLGFLWQIVYSRRSHSEDFVHKSKGSDIESIHMASYGHRNTKSLKAMMDRLDEVDKALNTLSAFREVMEQFKKESKRFDTGIVNGTMQSGPGSAVNKAYINTT